MELKETVAVPPVSLVTLILGNEIDRRVARVARNVPMLPNWLCRLPVPSAQAPWKSLAAARL
jgi:hypothetical protein